MNNKKTNNELSIQLHKKLHGKISSSSKIKVRNERDLGLVYTPGVGAVSSLLASNPELASEYTIKSNTVAVISDGSSVLGLGNTGPYGALPVMEGKSMLFSQLAGLRSFPIVLDTQDTEEIISTIKHIAPAFAAINLEDIEAPKCFEIERRLQEELTIPVVHDDQHATAIVVLAGLINALKVVGKSAEDCKVVLLGVGAAGIGTARLLVKYGFKDIILVDSKGIIVPDRADLNSVKKELALVTNNEKIKGGLAEALNNADIFIGLSTGGKLTARDIKLMNNQAIIFALANPDPEIIPEDAIGAGAGVVATGRSDFPNQINNVLVFPGLFKGLIMSRKKDVTDEIKLQAAKSLAGVIKKPSRNKIIPSVFDKKVVSAIAQSIL
ncbi:MAG: NADP-dependent malic enzyme [Candidatus Saccharibacteria bacterium]